MSSLKCIAREVAACRGWSLARFVVESPSNFHEECWNADDCENQVVLSLLETKQILKVINLSPGPFDLK